MKKLKQKTWNNIGYVYITLVAIIIFIGFINNNRDTNAEVKPNTDIRSLHNEYNSKGEQFLTIPKTNGSTEIEKMQEMIDYYGSPIDHAGLLNFYLESRKVGIDAVVPFCMAVVDSQLATKGKGVRTKNPCNYGNTDGGGTKTYKRYRDGLDMCYKGLLRPQFRNDKNASDLSVGGRLMTNRSGSGSWNNGTVVWASSPENWNINITNCISEIKGIPKEEALYFNFRIN